MPNIYNCTLCNRSVKWQGEDTFTETMGKQHTDYNIPIICCECDRDLSNLWFPENPTKELITVWLSRYHVCSLCGIQLGYGSSGGMKILGDKKDEGKSFHVEVKGGLCQRCASIGSENLERRHFLTDTHINGIHIPSCRGSLY